MDEEVRDRDSEHGDAEGEPADDGEEELREELYDQFDVTWVGRLGIKYIIPILERTVDTESRYDIDERSKILAEIALWEAYDDEPKFRMFAIATVLIGIYDLLHTLNPAIYSVFFIALASLNGFVSSLRSPSMIAAEVEGAEDENGMPGDYRSTAYSSVNTNVTVVLFVIAVGVQVVLTSSLAPNELLVQNIADGSWHPVLSAGVLFLLPLIFGRIRSE